MYNLKPTAAYMLDEVLDDPDAMERVHRILGAVGKTVEETKVFKREEVYDVVRELEAWPGATSDGGVPIQHQRALVFTKLTLDRNGKDPLVENRPEDIPAPALNSVLGHITLVRNTHAPVEDERLDIVCWNTQDFGVMNGCPHGCHYCGTGKNAKFTAIGANIGEYIEKVVGPTIEANPAQKCFRMIGWGADIITLEPEYSVFESFLGKLSEYDGRYGYFHTGSDNVDWVETVPNRDRLIGVWSMACDAVAEQIEPASPSPARRIEAARKCREWGVPVRFKFKPMIPVRNWREEYARTIRRIFERTRPESVGFCVLMWMNLNALEQRIDLDLLDPEYVRAARDAAGEMADIHTGPFPHRIRAEIYRFLIREVRRWDEKVPLYISTESPRMWDDLGDELGQNPRIFICGCNPIQAPGPTMVPIRPLNASTYIGKE